MKQPKDLPGFRLYKFFIRFDMTMGDTVKGLELASINTAVKGSNRNKFVWACVSLCVYKMCSRFPVN